MTIAEIEAELATLRATNDRLSTQIAEIQARDAIRREKWRPIVTRSLIMTYLFAGGGFIFAIGLLLSRDNAISPFVGLFILTSIVLGLLSSALSVWCAAATEAGGADFARRTRP
jgi:hypothetical protein